MYLFTPRNCALLDWMFLSPTLQALLPYKARELWHPGFQDPVKNKTLHKSALSPLPALQTSRSFGHSERRCCANQSDWTTVPPHIVLEGCTWMDLCEMYRSVSPMSAILSAGHPGRWDHIEMQNFILFNSSTFHKGNSFVHMSNYVTIFPEALIAKLVNGTIWNFRWWTLSKVDRQQDIMFAVSSYVSLYTFVGKYDSKQ